MARRIFYDKEKGRMSGYDIHTEEDGVKFIREIFREMDLKDKQVAELNQELNTPTDEKLAQMKAELDKAKADLSDLRSSSLYCLSKEEKAESQEWWKEHKKTCPHKGRNMRWVITPLGIGTCVKYVCSCGEKLDLTDISNW